MDNLPQICTRIRVPAPSRDMTEMTNPVHGTTNERRSSHVAGLKLNEDGTIEDMHEDMSELRWFHVVPCVNMVYDLIFDVSPTPDQMKEILNIQALILALLFSMALALPAAFDFEEVETAMLVIQVLMSTKPLTILTSPTKLI